MWNVGEEEELEPVWCRLSTSQWLFVSYRETPEGLLLFIYLFLRGITQVGDYRAACHGNWPGFASRLHANGAAGLQRGGCRPQHLCGGSSSNNPSLSVSLLVWGRFKFAFVELWSQRPLNLKMTCWLNACAWQEDLWCWSADFYFFFWLFTHKCVWKVAHDKMMVHTKAWKTG